MSLDYKNILSCFAMLTILTGCAALHSVQVGMIDNRGSDKENLVPFEIMVSETGVSLDDIKEIGKYAGGDLGNASNSAAETLSYFQMGPRTGNPIYNEKYAEGLQKQIFQKCPSGRVTALVSIRETMKYPVISGEIIKIRGLCRTTAARTTAMGDQ
jgi:hypothetical protein